MTRQFLDDADGLVSLAVFQRPQVIMHFLNDLLKHNGPARASRIVAELPEDLGIAELGCN